jgi:hypothetical protein
MVTIGEVEVARAADGITGHAVLDMAVADEWMPFGHAVEVENQAPDLLDRCVDHVAGVDAEPMP